MRIGGHLWRDFISVYDYLLLPFYLLVIYIIAYRFCNKHYPVSHPWRKYFLFAFTLKIIGSILIGLIYQYYYKGGDTSAYFYHAKVINQSLNDSIINWIKLLFHIPEASELEYYKYTSQMMWYKDPSSYLVSGITAVVNIFTFNTYLPSNVLFAAISFTGFWALFKTFAFQYPKLSPSLAISILFIPSTIMWGSGIFKDTICMAALGWLTYFAFKMIFQKKLKISYLLIIALCCYLLAIIKIYILLVFLPSLLLWIMNTYSHLIKNSSVRVLTKLTAILSIIAGFIYFTSAFSQQLGQYSLEKVVQTSNTTREYILWVSNENESSGYDLGEIEPTITGMLKKFPQAVNVALFRPYLWEAGKPIVFLNALEAFLFLFFTLKVIFKVGITGTWLAIARSPNIQFCLLFTIIFAFAVGISSYNFGALSRYRIPCLPFYATSLLLIYYSKVDDETPFFTFRLR